MRRTIFDPEHDSFRETARTFFEKECVPHADEWEERGQVDREVWLKAGALGLIGWEMPEEYGGADIKDFRFNAILNEEYWATGTVGIGLGVQNDILSGYFRNLTTAGAEEALVAEVRLRASTSPPSRCPNRESDPTSRTSGRPRRGTATTTSSTGPRRSSATDCSPTWWSSRAAPTPTQTSPTRASA